MNTSARLQWSVPDDRGSDHVVAQGALWSMIIGRLGYCAVVDGYVFEHELNGE